MMGRGSFTFAILALALWPVCGVGSFGVWARADKTPFNTARFEPDFTILKLGAFSNSGVLKPLLTNAQLGDQCARRKRIDVWVAHKIGATETISGGAGERLGKQLNQILGPSCVEAVELDIEPMPMIPPWFLNFLGHVRRSLAPRFRLHLAVPLITTDAIPGPHWPAHEVVTLLQALDGIDIMAYDTGAQSPGEYSQWLAHSVRSLGAHLDHFSNKVITLGLPAYHDRTALHSNANESPLAALTALMQLNPALTCRAGVRYAFYAEWTMTPNDRTMAARLVKWRKNGCR